MRHIFIILLVSFAVDMAQAKSNTTTLSYKIEIDAPQTHYAKVRISIGNCSSNSLNFKMPVWTPGSYLIREFEKSVEAVKAYEGNNETNFEHNDKNTWTVNNTKGKNITLEYKIYAFEPSVRTSFIDAEHAFLHNTSVFMCVQECMELNGTLELSFPNSWKNLSSSMDAAGNNTFAFKNYDELADSPIEIGNHELLNFEVMGVPHQVAMVGLNNCDLQKFTKDLQKICETMANIIGVHPSKKYLFIVHNVEAGGGGLEHANSCTVMMGRWNWINAEKYQGFIGLCAHEYFHLWNVKRLRPKALGPFNYDAENYTDLLWVAEGITSYYDELALLRAGWIDRKEYLHLLETSVNALENRPGVLVQTLAQSSHDAWIKEYRPNENSKNTTISYYAKGMVVAALLDAEICASTKGNKNLDDLMKLLYFRYYVKENRGFTASEFEAAASEVCGKDLKSFFSTLVYSTETPNYKRIFENAGLEVKDSIKKEYDLGITTALENGKTIVKYVNSKGAAWIGGINVNDELISLNGARVNNDVAQVLKNIGKPGLITAFICRAGIVSEITFQAMPLNVVEYQFAPNTLSGPHNLALEKWLGK
ncbi:MAG: M61 family metallopeptidase [Bacteroidia bacterium]|nr:M61 family metallopeptidase [Bacteroidia bacterium]